MINRWPDHSENSPIPFRQIGAKFLQLVCGDFRSYTSLMSHIHMIYKYINESRLMTTEIDPQLVWHLMTWKSKITSEKWSNGKWGSISKCPIIYSPLYSSSILPIPLHFIFSHAFSTSPTYPLHHSPHLSSTQCRSTPALPGLLPELPLSLHVLLSGLPEPLGSRSSECG